MILGVPHIVRWSPPSDYLQPFHISYQHGFAILGHLVLGSYPWHGLGVFGLKDATEQGPVHGPRLNSFGAVGAVAVHALLADVNLPAAKIGGGWFHGFWFRFNKHIHELATFSQHPLKFIHASDYLVPVPSLLNHPLPPFLREGLLALGVFELQEHGPSGGQVYHVAHPRNHAHGLHHAPSIGRRGIVVNGEQSAPLVGEVVPVPLEALGLNLELLHGII